MDLLNLSPADLSFKQTGKSIIKCPVPFPCDTFQIKHILRHRMLNFFYDPQYGHDDRKKIENVISNEMRDLVLTEKREISPFGRNDMIFN